MLQAVLDGHFALGVLLQERLVEGTAGVVETGLRVALALAKGLGLVFFSVGFGFARLWRGFGDVLRLCGWLRRSGNREIC
jgi:hypothetical protein